MTTRPESANVAESAEGKEVAELESREKGKYLPAIHRIVMPNTTTQSAKIRWLHLLGYATKDIAAALGIRYQQARNIITTEPKRAAREDIPPLEIQLADIEDIVDLLLGQELDRTFAEERRTRKRDAKRQRNAHAKHGARLSEVAPDDAEEVDEITEMFEDDVYNEEDDNDA